MLNRYCLQRGMTLIEVMIAGVIALIALSSVLTVYSATANHSTQQLQQAHLHQQLGGVMHLVSSDLKRAGYPGLSIAQSLILPSGLTITRNSPASFRNEIESALAVPRIGEKRMLRKVSEPFVFSCTAGNSVDN